MVKIRKCLKFSLFLICFSVLIFIFVIAASAEVQKQPSFYNASTNDQSKGGLADYYYYYVTDNSFYFTNDLGDVFAPSYDESSGTYQWTLFSTWDSSTNTTHDQLTFHCPLNQSYTFVYIYNEAPSDTTTLSDGSSFSLPLMATSSKGWCLVSNQNITVHPPLGAETTQEIRVRIFNESGKILSMYDTTVPLNGLAQIINLPAVDGGYVPNTSNYSYHYSVPYDVILSGSLDLTYKSISSLLEKEYNNGYNKGYNFAKSTYYESRYQQGYQDGYKAGGNGSSGSIKNPVMFFLEPVTSFLNIQLYPGLNLGILFAFLVGSAFIVLFLKIFGGG